ncbi:MAG: MarR family transcriptional regulator [Desulfobacteraceae bacterium]|nr:MarR family transcriptional regulator [Desulfobacteraceae bacterium]
MENNFKIENCLGFIANRFVKEFQRSFDAKLSRYGLTCAQFCVLVKLFEEDGLTQTKLAERLYIENPTLVRTLDRLESSDLIERRRDEGDRRTYHIYLLPKARELKGVIEKAGTEMNKKVIEGFDRHEIDDVRNRLIQLWRNLAKK